MLIFESVSGEGVENNVVTILNDVKDFCCFVLKCSIMLCFRNF